MLEKKLHVTCASYTLHINTWGRRESDEMISILCELIIWSFQLY